MLEQVKYRNKYIDTSSQRLTEQSVVAIGQQKVVKKIEFTKYEYCVSGILLLIILGIAIYNLTIIHENEHMKHVIDEVSLETMRLKNQTNNILEDIKIQYDYSAVKAAAESKGLILQQGNVKDLSKK